MRKRGKRSGICVVMAAAWAAAFLGVSGAFGAEVPWRVTFDTKDVQVVPTDMGGLAQVQGCVHRNGQTSAPDLPAYQCRLLVPADFRVTDIVVTDVRYTQLDGMFELAPVQPPQPTNGARPMKPAKPDPRIYKSSTPYPAVPVAIVNDGYWHGNRVVTVQVHPLRYHPMAGKLEVATDVAFSLQGVESRSQRPVVIRRSAASDARERAALARYVDNVSQVDAWRHRAMIGASENTLRGAGARTTDWPSLEGLPVDMVIVTSDELVASFEPLAAWKQAKGLNTVIKTVSDITANYPGVDAAERIRSFLTEARLVWGTDYVLLGGDVDQVPARMGFYDAYETVQAMAPTDLYYATIVGTWNGNGNAIFGEWENESNGNPGDDLDAVDENIELDVGRAPVEDVVEANTFVQKIIDYEKNPPAGYIESALLLGASLTEYNDTGFGQACMERIYDDYLPASYDSLRLYNVRIDGDDGLLTRSSAMTALAEGYHYFCHADHSNPRGMGTGSKHHGGELSPGDIMSLQTGGEQCVTFSLGCSPNAFHYASISEAFLNNLLGGGVAFMGNTSTGYSYQKPQAYAFFEAVFVGHQHCLGTAFSQARMCMAAASDKYYRRCMNMLGDPSMVLWTAEPGDLLVVHPSSAVVGAEAFAVTVRDSRDGSLLEGATVCLSKDDEVYDVVATGPTGVADFLLDCDTPGDLAITVTAVNYRPYEDVVQVYAANEAHLYVSQYDVDDDTVGLSDGNGDGLADAGETLELIFSVTNNGTDTVVDATATLVVSDPHVTAVRNKIDLGDVAPGVTVVGSPFVIALDADFTPEAVATLDIEFRGKIPTPFDPGVFPRSALPRSLFAKYFSTEVVRLPVHAPVLQPCRNILVDVGSGQSSGNGNGVPETGEIVEFYFELGNAGHGAARGVTCTATTSHPNVNILDATAGVDGIGGMSTGTTSDPVLIRFPSEMVGDERFELTLSDAYRTYDTIAVDMHAPIAPSQPDFTAGSDHIHLTWDPPQSGLAGYHVYRSLTEEGPYTRLTDLLQVGSTLFRDDDVGPPETAYYQITAVADSGNESEASPARYAWLSEPLMIGWPQMTQGAVNSSVALVDVDADGEPEIFASTQGGYVMGFHTDGRELYDLDGNPTTVSGFARMDWNDDGTIDGTAWGAPAVGDLNGDGIYEVIVTSRGTEGRIYAWQHVDNDDDHEPDVLPNWPVQLGTGQAGRSICAPALGDVNDDDNLEVVFTTENGAVHVLTYDGQELSTPGGTWPITGLGGCTYPSPCLVDLDFDGDLEIITGGANGNLYVWHHDTTPFAGSWPFVSGYSEASSPVVGDLDGDGFHEIVQTFGSRVFALETDGTEVAGWEGGKYYPRQPYVVPTPVLADVTHDNVPEVFLNTKRGVRGWQPDGTQFLDVDLGQDSESISTPAVADIDGDGEYEIVFGSGQGEVRAYEMDGSVVLRWPMRLQADEVRPSPTIEDIDDDGDLEVIMGAEEKLYIWDCVTPYSEKLIQAGTFHYNAWRTGYYNNLPPIGGRLTLPGGAPAAGARVTLIGYGVAGNYGTFADDDGQYTFWPAAGTYQLRADCRDGLTQYHALNCAVHFTGTSQCRVNMELYEGPLPSCIDPPDIHISEYFEPEP